VVPRPKWNFNKLFAGIGHNPVALKITAWENSILSAQIAF
jgi:hypothetical protein